MTTDTRGLLLFLWCHNLMQDHFSIKPQVGVLSIPKQTSFLNEPQLIDAFHQTLGGHLVLSLLKYITKLSYVCPKYNQSILQCF